jgi:hypothetical protein
MAKPFAALKAAYRAWTRPGIPQTWLYDPNENNLTVNTLPEADEGANFSPLCDRFGNQWIRDAGKPSPAPAYYSVDAPNTIRIQQSKGRLLSSQWSVGVDSLNLGVVSGGTDGFKALKIGVIKIGGFYSGIAGPLYLQMFFYSTIGNPIAPVNGDIANWSFAMPTPDTHFEMDFGVDTPQSVGPLGAVAGAGLFFSSTPSVLTAVAPPANRLFGCWAQWAGLGQVV